jgi:hypothetical protein
VRTTLRIEHDRVRHALDGRTGLSIAECEDADESLPTNRRQLLGGKRLMRSGRACPTVDKDRIMYKDFAQLAELIASGGAELLR